MIRSRLSFQGFNHLIHSVTDENNYVTFQEFKFAPWSSQTQRTDIDGVRELVNGPDADTFSSVQVAWNAVYTPDPTSANFKWACATPSATLTQTIGNIHAVRDILDMIDKAQSDGRKNNGYPTIEFYCDVYEAPSED